MSTTRDLELLWIHCLVGVSHFTKFHKNRRVTVRQMVRNLVKSLFHNSEENGKVIQNPHVDANKHQRLITSRGSSLAHAYHFRSMSIAAIVSYPAYRQNEGQNK